MKGRLPEIIAGVSAGVLVPALAALVAVYILRRRARHQTLLGTVIAPGLGPETTLVRAGTCTCQQHQGLQNACRHVLHWDHPPSLTQMQAQ